MKKYKKSILALSVVTVFLLLSAVTSGAAIVKKEAYIVKSEKSPVASGFFDNFSLNGSIFRMILNVLYTINNTLNNATNIIEDVIIPIVTTMINFIESILEMPIFNPEVE